MDRVELLNLLIRQFGYRRYLEIGVYKGATFRAVEAGEKVGVDPARVPRSIQHQVFRMTSDEFFAQKASPEVFDLVFIDGLHHQDQVLRDIFNALGILSDDGTIVLHDCNPKKEAMQRVPYARRGEWCGDVWKAMVELRFRHPGFRVFTIDADYGLGIVQRTADNGRRSKSSFAIPDTLTWEWLAANRTAALGLVSAAEAKDLLLTKCGSAKDVVDDQPSFSPSPRFTPTQIEVTRMQPGPTASTPTPAARQTIHFLMTRFNVAGDREISMPRYQAVRLRNGGHLDDDWLRQRVGLFERWTLPSVASQNSNKFRWLVFFDARSPKWLRRKANAWRAVEAVWLDEFSAELAAEAVQQRTQHDWAITTRLDSDDALAYWFCREVRQAFRSVREWLDFEQGYVWYKERFSETRKPSNPFLSLCELTEGMSLVTHATTGNFDHHDGP